MDFHRKMMQRRQVLSGALPLTSTTSIRSTSTNRLATVDPLPPTTTSTVNRPSSTSTSPSPTPTTSKTTSLTSSSSSSSKLSSSSSISSSSSSSTPRPSSPTSSPTSLRSSQTPLPVSTSFTQLKPTSLTSSPSPTSSGDSTGTGATISTGAVVGGIAAGLLGLAGIIFALIYFIRRLKRKRDNTFDSDVFRRQSRMLHDEPHMVPDHSTDSPFAPRPPTMIERRMNATPVSGTGSNNYGPGPAYGPGPTYGGYEDHNASYNHPGFAPGQVTPHHQSYGDSYMGSPMSPMSVNHGGVGTEQSQSAYLSRQLPASGPAPVDAGSQYVDLSRSSVTPFQAAQYEEIHRHLNMPPPAPVLGSLSEEEYPQREPVPKGPSPFADPSEDVLPPPSPVHSNRSRIDSSPPRLPELNPPMSPVYGLHPAPAEAPNKRTDASPADIPAAPAPAHIARTNPTNPNQKRPDTVYTIYDDEDAYGGI